MKTILLFIIFIYVNSINSQTVSFDYVLNKTHIDTNEYSIHQEDGIFFLPSDFSNQDLFSLNILDSIKKSDNPIYRIDLVYTKYVQSKSFDQRKLNLNRLIELKKTDSSIFDNNLIEWKVYRQIGDTTLEKNRKNFHGFVIHTLQTDKLSRRNVTKKLSTEEEIAYCKTVLATCGVIKDFTIKCDTLITCDTTGKYLPILKRKREKGIRKEKKFLFFWRKPEIITDTIILCDSIRGSFEIKCYDDSTIITHDTTGKYLPILKRKRKKGIRKKRKFLFFWRKPEIITDTTAVCDTTSIDLMRYGNHDIIDTVVLEYFRRNKNWKNTIVVEDVTGSMYPYITQTFLWIKTNLKVSHIQHFVFFNDGDKHPDGPIGNSKGAYYINSTDIDEVEEKAFSTMKKGGGGAGPENDIESMLLATESFDSCESIILIADNWAPVRDLSLLERLNIPVRVLLCGYRGAVNKDYIKIALKTKGSIHTIDNDLNNLEELTKKETFKIGEQTFKLKDGKLILIN